MGGGGGAMGVLWGVPTITTGHHYSLPNPHLIPNGVIINPWAKETSKHQLTYWSFIMARKANVFSFTRTIAEKREEVARVREEIATLAAQSDAFAPAYAIANALAKKAETIGFAKSMSVRPSTYIRWDGSADNDLYVRFEDTVESMKEGKVPAMIEAAESLGFEVEGSKDFAADYCAYRTFKFGMKINGVNMILRVEAMVKDGSEACRKVQTGVKLEEVAQYEIVCA